MKKVLLALIPVTLLAACNNDGGPTELDLTLNATGIIQNWDPGADAELSATISGTKTVVGKITATDNKVSIDVTPAQATAGTMRSFNELVNAWKASGSDCDYSKLVVVDTPYRGLERFEFNTQSGQASYVVAQASVKNADGTITTNRTQFFYAKQAGSLVGKVACTTTAGSDYNIVLKPGWNTVQLTWTYNPATQKSGMLTYSNAKQTHKYDGPWEAYAASTN